MVDKERISRISARRMAGIAGMDLLVSRLVLAIEGLGTDPIRLA
jgi:hypothetical protein